MTTTLTKSGSAKSGSAKSGAVNVLAQEYTGITSIMVLARQALSASAKGFATVWSHEMENKFGRTVVIWSWDIFVAVALPILSFLWLGVSTFARFVCKPETWKYISAQCRKVSDWLSLKFGSEPEKECAQLSIDVDS